ncbi:hypothetical protein BKA64DRAFT_668533 [Cadophora sp. MPI-SDFR-AT-0126]|nr:hypothetical protein BKA64DRAFT_668533 [Leotiomycetes sp. MPI-SDFR-AT-0126]
MASLLFSSLLVSSASAVINEALQNRANYEGSWAVAIPGASCPAEAPVLCDTDSITTTGCCPSGDTCFGLGGTYCCPTKSDCSTTVTNFPSCFNNTWTLYAAKTTNDYFCCPPGQYGVLPLGDYGGICQYNDVAVESSRSATEISQLGTRTTPPPTTRTATITSTRNDGVETTITEVVTGKTTATTEASPAGTSGSVQVPSGNDNDSGSSSGSTTSSSKNGLSAGAIAGIVIGSLGVLALFLVAFMLYRRNSKRSNAQQGGAGGPIGGTVEGYGGGMQQGPSAPSYSAVPQSQDNYPISVEPKSPAMQAASPVPTGYTQAQPYGNELPNSPANGAQGPYEAPVPPRWEGRAEMGSNRG